MLLSIAQYADYVKPQHVPVLLTGARQFQLYVLIRKTNRAALEYIGRLGYTGKRLDCKWKTASQDVRHYRLAGLVASPEIQPMAFAGAKQEAAWREWRQHQELILQFAARHRSRQPGFTGFPQALRTANESPPQALRLPGLDRAGHPAAALHSRRLRFVRSGTRRQSWPARRAAP